MLGEHPDTLCAEIIRNKTAEVFGDRSTSETPASQDVDPGLPNDSMDIDYDMSMSQQVLPFPQNPVHRSSFELSQLLFIVGHVAIKQIVHLEVVEAAWKKKKTSTDGKDIQKKEKEDTDSCCCR